MWWPRTVCARRNGNSPRNGWLAVEHDAQDPIEVCITVDTEFSIGGNFDNPAFTPVAEPMVLGPVGGKEQGLGFLLDSLAEFGHRATFFVEALQTAYFGDERMGSIARRIAASGHDVQLHLHPCWLHYEQPEAPKMVPNDSCAGRTDAELRYFFDVGLSVFARWGLPTPVAVRAGNFKVDRRFFRVAEESGLRLSSSIAVPVCCPPCDSLALFGGKHRVGGMLELPVFCYNYRIGGADRRRALCITACSAAEIISVLRQAHARRLSPVVILTHPQEFLKKTDFHYTNIRRNRVNQARLRALLAFLKQHQDQFVTTPISEISDDLGDSKGIDHPSASVSRPKALARIFENGINDGLWWY